MADIITPADPVTWIESGFSHYIIIGCSVLGLVWGGVNAVFVSLAPKLAASSGLCPLSWLVPPLITHLSLGVGQQCAA